MKQAISLIILFTILLFTVFAIASDKVVVVPLGGEAVGDATAADVVKGKIFSSKAAGKGVTGILEHYPIDQTYTTPTYGMTFNLLPADTFTMGSPDGSGSEPAEPGRGIVEVQHEVTLTKSFYIQTTEVTQQQWQDVVQEAEIAGHIIGGQLSETPSMSHSNAYRANYPVESVSWNDINIWISALNQLTGKTYSLPTEAQWEYAARAGTTTAYANPFSFDVTNTEVGNGFNSNLAALGWYTWNRHNSGYVDTTKPVAQKQPNRWGLYDMHGNVSEWCNDWWDGIAYSADPVTDPTGNATGTHRVIRGGGWFSSADSTRSAYRYYSTPGIHSYDLGFRLVLPSGQ